MSISNKKKLKLKKEKKSFIKRLIGIIMFVTGIIFFPIIIIILLINNKTKLSFISKLIILKEVYIELLTANYKSLKDRK